MPQDDDPSIKALYELEQDVSPTFMSGVRKKIYRRTAVNQVAVFSWNLPKVILVELIALTAHFLSGKVKGNDTNDG